MNHSTDRATSRDGKEATGPDALPALAKNLVLNLGLLRHAIEKHDLDLPAVQAIIEIACDPGTSVQRVSDALGLDRSTTSRKLSRLESLNLVRREKEPLRAPKFFLTGDGERVRVSLDRVALKMLNRAP
jgi:DNA-binding MarR family transcriptional regulator